jgi:hypothetical protein
MAQHGVVSRALYGLKRWMYPGNRPNRLAKALNRLGAVQYAAGVLSPERAVTLEVVGRTTGKVISFPLVLTDYQGGRYLVSMMGEDVNWVRNVRAAAGEAVLRRRGTEPVRLQDVPPEVRAPILKRYLELAPGARPHVPVDRHAALSEFEQIADRLPVFRVVAR